MSVSAIVDGPYRTAARVVASPPIPRPPARTLFAPLAAGGLWTVALVGPPALFRALIAPAFLLTAPDVRLVPAIDTVEDALAVAALGTLALVLAVIVRRVRPVWQGLTRGRKIAYVAAMLVAQLFVVAVGELVLFEARGGPHFFEPSLARSSSSSDGHVAHVYKDSFLTCDYDLYVARPGALTMHRAARVSRCNCAEPLPAVRWDDASTPRLFAADGAPFEPQPRALFFFFGGGC